MVAIGWAAARRKKALKGCGAQSPIRAMVPHSSNQEAIVDVETWRPVLFCRQLES
jgi:hypothetical protein